MLGLGRYSTNRVGAHFWALLLWLDPPSRIEFLRNDLSSHNNTEKPFSYLRQQNATPELFVFPSLYATFAVAFAVALVVVVTARFIRSWHVPERAPVVTQVYPKQQERVATLHDAPAGVQAWRGLTSSFASRTATGAASGRTAGTASETATGIGSGNARAREKNIMAPATMTLKGIMIALVEEDQVCGRYGLVYG